MTREERRKQILFAAARVFFINGFDGTKMDDIAKEAGIAKGTIYEYFPSKEQLYDEMIKSFRQSYLQKIQGVLKQENSFRENFITFVKYQTEFTKEHMDMLDSMSKSKMMARELATIVLEMHTVTDIVIKELMEKARKNQEFSPDLNMEIATSMVLGTINEFFVKKVILYGYLPDKFDFEQVLDTLLDGIGDTAK